MVAGSGITFPSPLQVARSPPTSHGGLGFIGIFTYLPINMGAISIPDFTIIRIMLETTKLINKL
jgi:hypothetical protein